MLAFAAEFVGSDRLHGTASRPRHRDVAAGDCQFGWLQGVRNLLRQNSFCLQWPDLNRRRWTSETRLLTRQVLSGRRSVPGTLFGRSLHAVSSAPVAGDIREKFPRYFIESKKVGWWTWRDLNPRPPACKAGQSSLTAICVFFNY